MVIMRRMDMLTTHSVSSPARAAFMRAQARLSDAYGELAVAAEYDPCLRDIAEVAGSVEDARLAIGRILVPRDED